MKERQYSNLSEALEGLKNQGFDKNFYFSRGLLRLNESVETFSSDECRIIEVFRFEGESNPDDMAVLYVISTDSGLKGTITDAFGIYANKDLAEFMEGVNDNRKNEKPLNQVLPSDSVR